MSILKLWQYTLGSYSDDKTEPYDKPMLVIRTLWISLHVTTCLFIIFGNAKILGIW
jgi:hypothetical protein|tara:strand:+ start:631 stop:798 length:168 start_codon:yes stop_codon:yes gene_type:complete